MADLTIYGAGIFGLSLAWNALNRGARVTVIDPHGPGAGASGGVVGALQPHTPDPWNEKKQFQFESLMMAERFWAEVEATSGLASGYARAGRMQALASDREVALARDRAEAADRNWQGQAVWQVIDKAEAGPWKPPSGTGLFLHDTLSALLNPRRATASLAAAIRARGGTVTDAAAPAGVPVIWATGWQGLRELSDRLGRPVGNGVKGQAILLDHNAAGAAQIYDDGLHIIPHTDGTVAIGSTSERDFDAPDTTDRQLDDLLKRATTVLPVLHGARILKRWAGVRPRAQSRAPLLGPWPDRPGHFIANGGFKIGFGMAPKCAEVLVDLVLDDRDTIPDSFHTRHLT
ncbi:MAG: FAD-dependent oxidoreductase [Pseudomonadota bacterium]